MNTAVPSIKILRNNDIEISTEKSFAIDVQVSGVYNKTSQPECDEFMTPAFFPLKVEVCGLEKIIV